MTVELVSLKILYAWINLVEMHCLLNLQENWIVFVVLLGLCLQLRSSLRHKRGHLVDNESGVCILWGRNFKQAMSTFTLRAPMTKCHSQGNCATGVGRRCTEMSKPWGCPEIYWKTQALNYLSSLRIWSNQSLLPHLHHLENKTHLASGWEQDSSWTVSSSWTDSACYWLQGQAACQQECSFFGVSFLLVMKLRLRELWYHW